MDTTQPQLIEPVPIDDDLCTRLALIEDLGHAARLVFVAEQTSYEAGAKVCVIKRKLVLPYWELRPASDEALRFMMGRARQWGSDKLRLVR